MIIYDKEAPEYDKWYDSPLGSLVDEIETETVFSLLKPEKDMRILDAGCGTGNFSIKLAKKGVDVTGTDISQGMLDFAIQKAKLQNLDIDFIRANAGDLPFNDDSFDAAVAVTSFEFFDNIQEKADEIFRVVKPGGRVVIGTINMDSAWGKLYMSDYFRENTVFKYANFLNREGLENIRGGELIEIRESLFFPPGTDENELSPGLENKLKGTTEGGFLCGLWKK